MGARRHARAGVGAPRRPGIVRVGTSGYAYPHWHGRFYPPSVPQRLWLPHYAAHFATVELNSPFYRLPSLAAVRAWRAAVPPGFVFAVKASRYVTHVKRLRAPAGPLRLLLGRIRRLGPRLGPVLFQLPATFHADAGRLDGLVRALRRQRLVPGLRVALEVRHPSWLEADVVARLRAASVALCLADWAACPVTGPVTADFVYVRRHGPEARYAGTYGDAALAEDAARIRQWRREGRDVYVYFNNDQAAHAVRDARRLAALAAGASARSAGPGPAPASPGVRARRGVQRGGRAAAAGAGSRQRGAARPRAGVAAAG
jgi:uncharacterized protein YecE (DUF72 family)